MFRHQQRELHTHINQDETAPHVEPAVGFALKNVGANGAQEMVPATFTREPYEFDFTFRVPAGTTNPYVNNRHVFKPRILVNYVILSPSIRGNPVYFSVGQDFRYKTYSGVLYIQPEIQCPTGIGSIMYPIPANTMYEFCVIPYLSIVNMVDGYQDFVQLFCGYLPDLNNRLIYDLVK